MTQMFVVFMLELLHDEQQCIHLDCAVPQLLTESIQSFKMSLFYLRGIFMFKKTNCEFMEQL